MALKVYATFEPDGTFPAILAKDVEMPDGKRLSEVEFGGGGVTEEQVKTLIDQYVEEALGGEY